MRAVAAVGLVMFALAGCGGGSDDRLTSTELASRADAICAEYEQKVDALSDPQNFAELEKYAKDAGAALSTGLEELRDLEPPEDLESEYDRWLESGDAALGRIEELESLAAEEDQEAIEGLVKAAEAEDAESDRLAGQLGMKECADD